ncbi:hypothetical protein [Colwellia psychrerythraea]|uniref:Uncharacterized protein n=1 Tax=Colwellia psychrerythraea TaxID=28229 RepID=A0A099KKE3_COLPS|nr:hypothetical protein [Colwellia psychrerythraea]KGJ91274.1 hypothetical protein GAB14E_3426 [Colwellia psychrerythraea]
MGNVLSQRKIRNRQIRQSVLTLLLFCATFFAHSEHYTQVEFEVFSTFEQHDCHLCQQGIDTPPNSIGLYPVSVGMANIDKVQIVDLALVSPAYISPQLRAPPSFL